jgi:hypothetical protein
MYTFGSIKSDSDNFTDYIEEITGTDKNDPSDYFGITNAVVNGDNFTIYYNGTNIPVSVMSTTNLGSEHSSVTNGIKNGEWTDKNITRTTPKFYKLELDLK